VAKYCSLSTPPASAVSHRSMHYLKSAAPGLLGSETIKWNFTKFLVDREGNVLARYAPTTKPERLERVIEAAIRKPARS